MNTHTLLVFVKIIAFCEAAMLSETNLTCIHARTLLSAHCSCISQQFYKDLHYANASNPSAEGIICCQYLHIRSVISSNSGVFALPQNPTYYV